MSSLQQVSSGHKRPGSAGLRARLAAFVETPAVRWGILSIIILNAILLGMETSDTIMAIAGPAITTLDTGCLAIFVIEIGIKLVAFGPWPYVRHGWGAFDIIVVGVSLLPGAQNVSVLRAARVMRVLRVLSVAPQPAPRGRGLHPRAARHGLGRRDDVADLLHQRRHGDAAVRGPFPRMVRHAGPKSAYSLFQIMTLESWSMGIVRPVMEQHPYAWAFFVPFIIVTAFAVVNLLVGLIVNSMQEGPDEAEMDAQDAFREEMRDRLAAIERQLSRD